MPNVSIDQIKDLPQSKLLKVIDRVRKRLKKDKVVQDMFNEFDVDLDEIDFIPMAFAELEVSARTEHGIIYLNYNLLGDGDFEKDDHYIVHEMTHYLQQTTGDGPTTGSNDDDYLDNHYEQEGFQNQTKYLSETRGDGAAEAYTDKVLDHHEVPKSERAERKKELMNLAAGGRPKGPKQLGLFTKKKPAERRITETKEELDRLYDEAIERGPQDPHMHKRPSIKKLHPIDQEDRMRHLKEIIKMLDEDKNDAAYFWDESGGYNKESPIDAADINPNQTKLKFRDLSTKLEIFAKKFDQLSAEEIRKLQRLKLGDQSDMTDFFKGLPGKWPAAETPIAVIAMDKDNGHYVGWILVRPHKMFSDNAHVEVDTFVDKAYRQEGVGTMLMKKFNEIRSTNYKGVPVEIGPWSPTASHFYQKTDMLEGDPYDRYYKEPEEEIIKEEPTEQLKLPI